MSTGDFRVADISLADFGRKEIEIAEHEVQMGNEQTSVLSLIVTRMQRKTPKFIDADRVTIISWT